MILGAVSWSAPPGCPIESELQQRLGDVRARVDARVLGHPAGFELHVSIDDQERTLVLPTCTEALESAVFLVELSGPSRTRRPLGSAQESGRRRPLSTRGAARPETVTSIADSQVEAPQKRFRLAVVAGAEVALLPAAVARLGVSLQLDVTWARFVLDLRGAPPLRFSAFDMGLSLSPLFDAQLAACRLFGFGRLELGPCAQASVGLTSAVGSDLAGTRTQLVSVWTAGGGLRAALILTEALELQAFASARFGPEVRYFFGDPGETALRSSFFGLDTGLGVGGRW